MFVRVLRALPDFKGKRMLMRFFLGEKIDSAKDLTVAGKFGIKYLLPNVRESISFDIFTNGIYEPETNRFLNSRIPLNAIFLDLGANIGSITLPLLKQRPDISFVCVEAAPWIFEYLKTNINSNQQGKNVSLVNKALHQSSGETLSFYSPGDQFGKGSLSPVFTNESIPVKSITIDDLVKEMGVSSIQFIKIDIEGFEYFAFKGGIQLLSASDAPDILFEFVDWAEERAGLQKGKAQEFLLDLGYSIFKVGARGLLHKMDKPLTQGYDMLFASKKRI